LKEYGYDMTNKVTVMMANGAGTGEKDRRNSTTGVVDLAATPPKDAQHDNFPRNLDGLAGNETILAADKTSILNKLDSWKPGGTNPLPSQANLIIFITGHGGVEAGTGKHYFYAWGGTGTGQYITDQDLMLELNDLTQLNSITLVITTCNGGGFASEFTDSATQKRRIFYAAAADESSWGNGFANALTTGYAGHTRYYNANCNEATCAADLNKGADQSPTKDERVLSSEAIAFAKLNDPFYTSSLTPVAGKERSNMQANPLAAADSTTQYLSACSLTASKTITVRDPAANAANWNMGTEHLITWGTTGMAGRNVKFVLMNQSVAYPTINFGTTGVSATSSPYPWTIPNDGSIKPMTTAVYKVKVVDTADSSVYGLSGAFKIDAAPATNSGLLKIVVTEKDKSPTSYPGPRYTITNPLNGALVTSGTVGTTSAGTTTSSITPQGAYWVGLTLDGFYPVSKHPAEVKPSLNTVTISMGRIPDGTNSPAPPDYPPYGGIDVSSTPSQALVWATKVGNTPSTIPDGITDSVIYLEPATYDIMVTKEGYQPSEAQRITVVSMTPDRVPVKMAFELTPLVQQYTVDGFFAPIDNPPTVNNAKAGQTVPAKWRLTNTNGYVSDPASFAGLYSYQVTCGTLSPVTTEIEEYASGNSGLQYLGSGNWQYNWKTPKTYSGKCREMLVRFNDGQELHTVFKFK